MNVSFKYPKILQKSNLLFKMHHKETHREAITDETKADLIKNYFILTVSEDVFDKKKVK